MKYYTILLFIALLLCPVCVNSQTENHSDSVEVIKDWEDLYHMGRFYISGQPELDELAWMKEQGVTTIINLRSHKENKEFAGDSFDEKEEINKLGLTYFSIPIQGREGYTPENLDDMINAIGNDQKVLIHCASGGRATQLFMAYLVKAEGYSIDEAVQAGKQMLYYIPLESLLDTRIFLDDHSK